jgi:hypothetical protein
MKVEGVLASLEAVLPGHGFRKASVAWKTGKLPMGRPDEIEAKIKSLTYTAGWIARQSGVVVLPDPDDGSLGAVLEAELGSDAVSLQIRRVGAEWVWTQLTEVDGDMLCEDVTLVTVQIKAALYRRYWTLGDEGAAEVVACRLVGYTEFPT